jgi:tetratricopeptide (TPR) repeat protein
MIYKRREARMNPDERRREQNLKIVVFVAGLSISLLALALPIGMAFGVINRRWVFLADALGYLFIALLLLWVLSIVLGALGYAAGRFAKRALWRADYDSALRWSALQGPFGRRFRASALILAGRPAEAERLFRGRAKELHLLAGALADQGRFPEAEECLEQALRLDIGDGSPCATFAEWRLAQGIEPEAALELVEQALNALKSASLKPAQTEALLASRLAVKARALAALGRKPEALAAIDEAFRHVEWKCAPALASIHWEAGMTFAALAQAEDANTQFRNAVELDPNGKYGKRSVGALAEPSRREGGSLVPESSGGPLA